MVFLTGSSGYIGIHVLEELNKQKIRCKLLIRDKEKLDKNYFNFKNINVAIGDLSDKEKLADFIKGEKIVVHLAASVHGKPTDIEKTNIEGTKNLIYACKKAKVKKIIFLSSMGVKRPFLEEYSKSKIEGENLLFNSGLKVVIIRPSMVYGGKNDAFLKIIKQVNSIPFIIPIFGNGKYRFRPVFIQDVVKSILYSMKNEKINGIYEIGSYEAINYNEFIKLIKEKYRIKKLTIHFPLFFVYFIANIFKLLSIGLITKEMIMNITTESDLEISKFVNDFKFKPISFKEGLFYKNEY